MTTTTKQSVITLERAAGTTRQFAVTLYDSTEPDRDGETIDVRSVRAREPVTLQADHDHSVLKTLGQVRGIHAEGLKLRGLVEFAPPGVSDVADQVFRQVEAGITQTVSIGFMGVAARDTNGRTRWENVELLELSFVSVPSSRGARVDAKAMTRWLGNGDADPMLDLADDGLTLEITAAFAAQLERRRMNPAVLAGLVDIEPDALRSALRSVVPAVMREHIQEQVAAGIRRALGRVD